MDQNVSGALKWEKVRPVIARAYDGVSVSTRLMKSSGEPIATFGITATLAEELGWKDVKDLELFTVVDTDRALRLVRFVEADKDSDFSETFKLVAGVSGSKRIVLQHVPWLLPVSTTKVTVAYQREGVPNRELILECPRTVFSTADTPRPPSGTVQEPKHKKHHPPQPRTATESEAAPATADDQAAPLSFVKAKALDDAQTEKLEQAVKQPKQELIKNDPNSPDQNMHRVLKKATFLRHQPTIYEGLLSVASGKTVKLPPMWGPILDSIISNQESGRLIDQDEFCKKLQLAGVAPTHAVPTAIPNFLMQLNGGFLAKAGLALEIEHGFLFLTSQKK